MYKTNKIHSLVRYRKKLGLTVCTGERAVKCNTHCVGGVTGRFNCELPIFCSEDERDDGCEVVFILLRNYRRKNVHNK